MPKWWNNIEGCYLDEGWDSRAWDNKDHYFVNNRALCGIGTYHPPYFDKGKTIEDMEEDYEKTTCLTCNRSLKNLLKMKRLDKFFTP